MKRTQWEKKLKSQIKFDAEYIPSFQTTIKILAEILEERDHVREEYIKDGSRPVTIFTTDRGSENLKPNPLLQQWQDLNKTAIVYLRDLGLTAAGLRKLQGQIPKNEPKTKLEDFFKEIEDDTSTTEPDWKL